MVRGPLSRAGIVCLTVSASGPGLKATIESIDNRSDFKVYMQNYAYAHGSAPPRGPRREGPVEEGFVSCQHSPGNSRSEVPSAATINTIT
jgi:hypothetical protein